MLKLDEELPLALAVVLLGQAPDMEEHGWPPPQGDMCTPAQGCLDLVGFWTQEAPLIRGALSIPEAPLIQEDPTIRAILAIINLAGGY